MSTYYEVGRAGHHNCGHPNLGRYVKNSQKIGCHMWMAPEYEQRPYDPFEITDL